MSLTGPKSKDGRDPFVGARPPGPSIVKPPPPPPRMLIDSEGRPLPLELKPCRFCARKPAPEDRECRGCGAPTEAA